MKRASRHSSQTKRRRRLLFGIVVVLVLGYLLPHVYAAVGAAVLYPVHQVSAWVQESSASLPQYLRDRASVLAELRGLEEQLAKTGGAELALSRLEEENARLRALLGTTAPERQLARVINRPPAIAYDHLQIDVGRADGVAVGAPVYTGADAVIGTVIHVGQNFAFVELVTSPGFESTAYVLGPDVFATLEGVGGGVARVRLPQGIDLAPSQLVVLPGLESGVYGEVVSVENLATQPEQYGYVAPPVPLSSVRYVTVGAAPPPERSVPEIEESIRAAARSHFSIATATQAALGALPATTTATVTPTVNSRPR